VDRANRDLALASALRMARCEEGRGPKGYSTLGDRRRRTDRHGIGGSHQPRAYATGYGARRRGASHNMCWVREGYQTEGKTRRDEEETEGDCDSMSIKAFKRLLGKGASMDIAIVTSAAASKMARIERMVKEERLATTNWESFEGNPAYKLMREYEDVFRDDLPYGLPRHGEHEMEVNPQAGAIHAPCMRQSADQERTIEEFVIKMVERGLMRESQSPHGAPTFCVRKPGGGWRVVHDFRRMNAATLRQTSPMPRKDRILDGMVGGELFSCFDLLSGYYQIRMRSKDVPYTAVQTPEGLFEYLVVPMGLSNAPATFNRIVRVIFRDLRAFVATYFDDIYVYTGGGVETHLESLKTVFERCREEKLYLKLKKSTVCEREIPCLGDYVGAEGVRIDPDKVSMIRDWPRPKNRKSLQSFLGTAVYVKRFVEKFSEHASVLFDMLKQKPKELTWSEEQNHHFGALQESMGDTKKLKIPEMGEPFTIETDASNWAVGAVLLQWENDPKSGVRRQRPVAYAGRKMTPGELNYPIREKEMLAVIFALKMWRIYLLDSEVTVLSDHKSLEGVLRQKVISERLARWYNLLAEHSLTFKYLPGAMNLVADGLSRRVEANCARREKATAMTTWEERVNQAQLKDPELIKIVERIEAGDREALGAKADYWRLNNGFLYYKGPQDKHERLVMPNARLLKEELLNHHHDNLIAGHGGVNKTYQGLRGDYYWTGMMKGIRQYIASCECCQRAKWTRGKKAGLLNPIEIPELRWEGWAMDFMVDLPVSINGYTQILVIVCRLTKRAHFIPLRTGAKTEDVADAILREVVRLHGLPKSIVSDRDSKFTSKLWRALADRLGVELKLSTAFHQQTDGQSEIINGWLGEYIRLFTSADQSNWDELLPTAEIAYNKGIHSSLGMAPFEADLGYMPRFLGEMEVVRKRCKEKSFWNLQADRLKTIREKMEEVQAKQKAYYDRSHKKQEFEIGDMVLLSTANLDPRHGGYRRRKLGPKFIGPYRVQEKVHDRSYTLLMPPALKLHPTFHTKHLKPYRDDDSPTRQQKVPAVLLMDGTVGEQVKSIRAHRHRDKGDEYQVEWVGSGPPTWEPVAHLFQVQWLVDAFIKKQQQKQLRWAFYRAQQEGDGISSEVRSCRESGRTPDNNGKERESDPRSLAAVQSGQTSWTLTERVAGEERSPAVLLTTNLEIGL
jgi:hypothetical protein